jgi:ornithine cyclodeaminase/alanine dehydrogenase-like protein (mu-crystallin family)
MSLEVRVLSSAEVREALPMAEAIEGMKTAFVQLSTGKAVVPLRGRVDVARHQGTTLVMPAFLQDTDDLAVKVVSIFPQNAARGEPVVYAIVLVLDAASGRPLAMMEGGTLTAIRTGAGAGAATDLLARPDAAVVAIIGSGVQARTQLEAVCTVRRIAEVRVYSPNPAHAAAFAEEMRGAEPVPALVRAVADADTAVRDADIVCAATTATEPVFNGSSLKPGVHINGVGSYAPNMQEIDAETVRRALVAVDSREAAGAEAGDLIIPLQMGLIASDHIHAELGEIIAGVKAGRSDDRQITFFKSVGVAAQDVVAGRIALSNALKRDLGAVVDL